MGHPLLSMIAAIAENGVIGKGNALPWHLPADLKHFKALTMGKPMVMGRKTFQSLKAPLPGRPHIVLSRDRALALPAGVRQAGNLDEAVALAAPLAGEAGEIMVIGGGEIFAAALDRADRLHLTLVHRPYPGDARFPAIDPARWRERNREDLAGDPAFSFVTLEKI